MSRILRRPMFRGGRVSSYGNGIATGLANGGMPNKRGFVDGPGGYAGKDILEYQEDFEERVPVKKGLSTGDYLRIASAGMDILGAPSEGGGIKGLLATAAKPLASLGTDLGSSMDKRAMSRDDRITNLSMAQAKLDTTKAQAFEKIERSKAVKLIFDGKISEIDKTLLDPRIANAVEGTDEYAAKVSLTKQRDNLIKTKEQAELKILIPGKSKEDYIIELTESFIKSGMYNDADEAKAAAESIVNGFAEGGVVENMSMQENIMETPQGLEETMSVEEDVKETSVDMPYENFRERIPATVPDTIVTLIYYNPAAFADFANIQTQDDVYSFNNKYDVQLVLPLETEAN
jgi:hypothetical protein